MLMLGVNEPLVMYLHVRIFSKHDETRSKSPFIVFIIAWITNANINMYGSTETIATQYLR